MINMSYLHPGILLIAIGIIATFVPAIVRKALLVIGPALMFIFCMMMKVGDTMTLPTTGLFKYDLVPILVSERNYIFMFVLCLLALAGGIYACHNKGRMEAFASMGYMGGAIGVVLAGDWITLLFFWEFMCATSLFLIWCNHTQQSRKAGFRYLLMHMTSGNLLLFGALMKVHSGVYMIGQLGGEPRDVAYWLILLAFAINSAIIPLHAWVPDAYPESTITGGVFLSSCTTKLTVLCLIRVFAGDQVLIVFGLIMIIYGACFAMIENDMRRLLSYHIVSQVGFMVADVGIGTELALNAAGGLAFSNVIYKSLLFMCAGAIMYATGIRKINQLGSMAKRLPILAICFFIGAFAITGVPGFAGFTCKSISMFAAEEAHMHTVELLMTLGSLGTALSIPFKMGYFIFFGPDRGTVVRKKIPANMYIGMFIMSAACLVFGIVPKLAYRMMPVMEYHPYTTGHVLEYVELLAACLIAFMLYLKIMEPHTALSLDTDWILRKPFKSAVYGLSRLACFLQGFFGGLGRRLFEWNISSWISKGFAIPHDPKAAPITRSEIGIGMIAVLIMIIIIFAVMFI